MSSDMIFLDIETLDWFEDVAGLPRWRQLAAMRLGLAVTWDAVGWREWWAPNEALYPLGAVVQRGDNDLVLDIAEPFAIDDLWATLVGKRVVTWNGDEFDIPLLAIAAARANRRIDPWSDPMTSIDLMKLIRDVTKAVTGKERWYELDAIALHNLGRGKIADGKLAAQWLRGGDGAQLQQADYYCRDDVQILRDLWRLLENDTGIVCPPRYERGEVGDIVVQLPF